MNFETLNYIYNLLINAEELAHNRKEIAQRDLHDTEECESSWIEDAKACYNNAYNENREESFFRRMLIDVFISTLTLFDNPDGTYTIIAAYNLTANNTRKFNFSTAVADGSTCGARRRRSLCRPSTYPPYNRLGKAIFLGFSTCYGAPYSDRSRNTPTYF